MSMGTCFIHQVRGTRHKLMHGGILAILQTFIGVGLSQAPATGYFSPLLILGYTLLLPLATHKCTDALLMHH